MRPYFLPTVLLGSSLTMGCQQPCENWRELQANDWGSYALFEGSDQGFEGLNKWARSPTVYVGRVADYSELNREDLWNMTERVVSVWNDLARAVDTSIPLAELSLSDEFNTSTDLDLESDIPAGGIVVSIPEIDNPDLDEDHAGGAGAPGFHCGDINIHGGIALLNGLACEEDGEDACLGYLSHEFGHALGLGHAYESGYLMSESGFSDADASTYIPSIHHEGKALECMYVNPIECVFYGDETFRINEL